MRLIEPPLGNHPSVKTTGIVRFIAMTTRRWKPPKLKKDDNGVWLVWLKDEKRHVSPDFRQSR
jgi:hypothetical protein